MNKFDECCTRAWVGSQTAADKAKDRARAFGRDESGMEMIAVVIILVIVVALGVLFRDAIGTLFRTLWGQISGENFGDV